jgi:hypothetical protein
MLLTSWPRWTTLLLLGKETLTAGRGVAMAGSVPAHCQDWVYVHVPSMCGRDLQCQPMRERTPERHAVGSHAWQRFKRSKSVKFMINDAPCSAKPVQNRAPCWCHSDYNCYCINCIVAPSMLIRFMVT